MGIIEQSNTEWCRPLVFKKDGSLQICIDFMKLNAKTEFYVYPMPRIDELLKRIGKALYIITLDFVRYTGKYSKTLNKQPLHSILHTS